MCLSKLFRVPWRCAFTFRHSGGFYKTPNRLSSAATKRRDKSVRESAARNIPEAPSSPGQKPITSGAATPREALIPQRRRDLHCDMNDDPARSLTPLPPAWMHSRTPIARGGSTPRRARKRKKKGERDEAASPMSATTLPANERWHVN